MAKFSILSQAELGVVSPGPETRPSGAASETFQNIGQVEARLT